MATHDVLDDREPESGPAQSTAAPRADAVEPLGQARQMFRGNARSLIVDGNPHAWAAARRLRCRRGRGNGLGGDPNGGVFATILDGVVDEIDEQLMELVRVAVNGRQAGGDSTSSLTRLFSAAAASGRRPRQHLAQVTQVAGRLMGGELDPRQREQVVDQPRHPVGLLGHDLEEAVARLGIMPCGTPQRLDEPLDRGRAACGSRGSHWRRNPSASARSSPARSARAWRARRRGCHRRDRLARSGR